MSSNYGEPDFIPVARDFLAEKNGLGMRAFGNKSRGDRVSLAEHVRRWHGLVSLFQFVPPTHNDAFKRGEHDGKEDER
jgi:hypothetical protein